MSERMLVVHCADWPAVAVGLPADQPVIVMSNQLVMSASQTARSQGVVPGLRHREAQARCPQAITVEHQPAQDMRLFEPIVKVVEAIATRVEVTQPGTCVVPTLGPSRYFGGDDALAQHLLLLVQEALRDHNVATRCSVGVADGMFAALLAARAETVVPSGGTPAFLAPQPVDVLERTELVSLLRRLGLRTLGDFAALHSADVLDRFGWDGVLAHQLAQGSDQTPLQARSPEQDFSVSAELDPPLLQMDTAAFVVKTLADRCNEQLQAAALACVRLRIDAQTVDGELLSRTWRHDGALTASAIAQRLRWQLEGWLIERLEQRDSTRSEEDVAIMRLALVPEDVIAHNGAQVDLWEEVQVIDDRIHRAVARVQGMLGESSVVTAVINGGRSLQDQIRLVNWGEPLHSASAARSGPGRGEVPAWPGKMPGISPSTVYEKRLCAQVLDRASRIVSVSGRGVLSAAPARLCIDNAPWEELVGWSGPWTIDERWWDKRSHRRCARFQLLSDRGSAVLASIEGGLWWIEGRYD